MRRLGIGNLLQPSATAPHGVLPRDEDETDSPARVVEGESADDEQVSVPPMRIISAVYDELREAIAYDGRETSALLLGPTNSDVITHVRRDKPKSRSSVHVSVGASFLNETVKAFSALGINAKGIAHSHPPGCNCPSRGDLAYVAKTFRNPRNSDCQAFMLPILCDGRLWPYVVTRRAPESASLAELVLV